MSNATPVDIGAINLGADEKALFLKVYGGMVMAYYEPARVFAGHNVTKTIQSGKSAQFPRIGKSVASYHTRGTEMLGTNMPFAEVLITIDDILKDDKFIADLDEAMSHFETQSLIAQEQAHALARSYDVNVATVGLNAARSAATITGQPGGTAINSANSKTNSADLAAAFFDAAIAMDEKNVSETGRHGFLRPAQYHLLSQDTNVIHQDWDGSGSYSEGKVYKIGGITLQKTNHLPTTNVTNGLKAVYNGDFRNTTALIMSDYAVGTLELIGMRSHLVDQRERYGKLLISGYAVGHGVLQPEDAVEIRTANPV